MKSLSKEEILKRLENDDDYYGEFGQQWLSNSDLKNLIEDPKLFRAGKLETTPALLQGGYFHTAILEPHKLKNFAICDAKTRNNKTYKELRDTVGPTLLQHEVDNIDTMVDTLMAIDELNSMIRDGNVEYEVPMIGDILDHPFKGKADILNHDKRLIIDLKTTGDILKFKKSAYWYSYNSQAFIYRELFGYDMVFIAIDKTSHQVGLYKCSDTFYHTGYLKVEQALEVYDKWMADGFDHRQHFLKGTL